jgi:hypothetical protein
MIIVTKNIEASASIFYLLNTDPAMDQSNVSNGLKRTIMKSLLGDFCGHGKTPGHFSMSKIFPVGIP